MEKYRQIFFKKFIETEKKKIFVFNIWPQNNHVVIFFENLFLKNGFCFIHKKFKVKFTLKKFQKLAMKKIFFFQYLMPRIICYSQFSYLFFKIKFLFYA